eukprot:SAG31_NODE_3571_length_4115_cov_3.648904_1_plen_1189_part_10
MHNRQGSASAVRNHARAEVGRGSPEAHHHYASNGHYAHRGGQLGRSNRNESRGKLRGNKKNQSDSATAIEADVHSASSQLRSKHPSRSMQHPDVGPPEEYSTHPRLQQPLQPKPNPSETQKQNGTNSQPKTALQSELTGGSTVDLINNLRELRAEFELATASTGVPTNGSAIKTTERQANSSPQTQSLRGNGSDYSPKSSYRPSPSAHSVQTRSPSPHRPCAHRAVSEGTADEEVTNARFGAVDKEISQELADMNVHKLQKLAGGPNVKEMTAFITKASGNVVNKTLPPHGRDALMIATAHRRVDNVEALLDAGARVDRADVHGWTAFHYACSSGSSEVVNRLLKAGCAVDAKERTGRTGRMLAAEQGFTDVVSLIDGYLGQSLGRQRAELHVRRMVGNTGQPVGSAVVHQSKRNLHREWRSQVIVSPGRAQHAGSDQVLGDRSTAAERHRQRHERWDREEAIFATGTATQPPERHPESHRVAAWKTPVTAQSQEAPLGLGASTRGVQWAGSAGAYSATGATGAVSPSRRSIDSSPGRVYHGSVHDKSESRGPSQAEAALVGTVNKLSEQLSVAEAEKAALRARADEASAILVEEQRRRLAAEARIDSLATELAALKAQLASNSSLISKGTNAGISASLQPSPVELAKEAKSPSRGSWAALSNSESPKKPDMPRGDATVLGLLKEALENSKNQKIQERGGWKKRSAISLEQAPQSLTEHASAPAPLTLAQQSMLMTAQKEATSTPAPQTDGDSEALSTSSPKTAIVGSTSSVLGKPSLDYEKDDRQPQDSAAMVAPASVEAAVPAAPEPSESSAAADNSEAPALVMSPVVPAKGLAGMKVVQGAWPPPKPIGASSPGAKSETQELGQEKKRRRSSNMVIDFEEFALLVTQELEVLKGEEIPAGGVALATVNSARLRRQFDALDVDGSGSISMYEYDTLMTKVRSGQLELGDEAAQQQQPDQTAGRKSFLHHELVAEGEEGEEIEEGEDDAEIYVHTQKKRIESEAEPDPEETNESESVAEPKPKTTGMAEAEAAAEAEPEEPNESESVAELKVKTASMSEAELGGVIMPTSVATMESEAEAEMSMEASSVAEPQAKIEIGLEADAIVPASVPEAETPGIEPVGVAEPEAAEAKLEPEPESEEPNESGSVAEPKAEGDGVIMPTSVATMESEAEAEMSMEASSVAEPQAK